MTAALSRAELAEIGADLIAAEGTPGDRRGAALLVRLHGSEMSEPPGFGDLYEVPPWLRLPRPVQTRIAHAAALASLAPMLAASIDGDWLGGLAKVAGEELVDWAIELPDSGGELELHSPDPTALTALGFGLLRARLRSSLRSYLGWAPGTVSDAPLPDVACWTDTALDAFVPA